MLSTNNLLAGVETIQNIALQKRSFIRMTGGNFRMINRLLPLIARVLKLNKTETATMEIVDAARESLIIGQA